MRFNITLTLNDAAACMTLLASAALMPAHAADSAAAHGKDIFDANCAVCHSWHKGKNKVGPSLYGVVGRPAASVPDYVYSDAIKSSKTTWTEDNIKSYLQGPQKFIPGVRMVFSTPLQATDVDDLITFLAAQRD